MGSKKGKQVLKSREEGFMKRVYQLVAAAVVTFLVPVAIGASVSAQQFTCDVGYTGPNSQNQCTSVETYDCSVSNTNFVTINSSTVQNVASGTVTVDGNGNGGGAISGSASNSNNTTFSVTIENGEGQVCTVVATVPATETPETVTPTQTVTKVAALPVTSGDSTLTTLMSIAIGAVALAGATIAAVLIYRRINQG